MLEILILVLGLLVGALGAMTGSGGAVLLVPLLVWLAGVPIKTAIGASLISVIATATTIGAAHVSHSVAHTRLSIVLQVATTLGALIGAVAAVFLNPHVLQVTFGLAVVFVVLRRPVLPHKVVTRLTGLFDAAYVDPVNGETVRYGIRNLPLGLAGSFMAGNISGLLGTGGGFIKVPLMTLVMGMPPQAAIATSNFMIAVTAATSAQIFYMRGYIDPRIAIPTTLGVLLGAQIGAHLGRRYQTATLGDRIGTHALRLATGATTRFMAPAAPAVQEETPVRYAGNLIVIPSAATQPGAVVTHSAPPVPADETAGVYVNHELLDLVTGRRPEEAATPERGDELDLNMVVHWVLLLGLVASGLLLLAGSLLAIVFRGTLPAVDPAPLDALRSTLQLRPAGLLALGLGVVVGTPIVCLVASLLVFLSKRDWYYTGITAVVLLIMLISVLIGAS
jgi:uncharacterized membrane protein YfcA